MCACVCVCAFATLYMYRPFSCMFFFFFNELRFSSTTAVDIRTLTNVLCAHISGDKFSTDWDKAWSKFRKQGKKTFFSQFSPDKYVSWNPRRSNYPLSEEVDPIKKAERSNLMLWTSPRFTLAGAIVIVTFLLVYTILSRVK
jgi:hypothetical protein